MRGENYAHCVPLQVPSVSDNFDYDGELAMIIGLGVCNIPKANACDLPLSDFSAPG